jgi:hypothetical protein
MTRIFIKSLTSLLHANAKSRENYEKTCAGSTLVIGKRHSANSKLVIMNKGNELYEVNDSQYHETEFEQ